MTRAKLEARIRADWPAIVAASNCDPLRSLAALPKGRLNLLGSSLKTELGEGMGVLTGVQYLAPAEGSGRNVCPNSTAACRAGCLGDHAGRMPMIRPSMQWKTALRLGAPKLYHVLLGHCLETLVTQAHSKGLQPAARLDGTSDLGDAEIHFDYFEDIQFYEYTKSYSRAIRWTRKHASNLSVTFSFSGRNLTNCIELLDIGGNVAVPFDTRKGETLPDEWHGFKVIDGDAHDYRPSDEPGTVVGLSWKGPNKTREAARKAGWLQEA